MNRIGLILISVFAVTVVLSQPALTTSSTEVLIGDRFTVMLEVPLETGSWTNDDIAPADSLQTVQILEKLETDRSQSGMVYQGWNVAVYDTGYVVIPPIPVVYSSGDTFYTNDLPIYVQGVIDSAGLAPIKPIVREPVKFSDYVPYILGLIGAVLVIAGMVWWSRRPKSVVVEEIVKEPDPPHIIALNKLDDLEKQELWQKGQIAEYHSMLSYILREYLEGRYLVKALESTTNEVRSLLRPVLEEDQFEVMMKMMQMEDLIKFAKAEPPVEIHAQHLAFVREFVHETKLATKTEADA